MTPNSLKGIERVFIDEDCQESAIAQRTRSLFAADKIFTGQDLAELHLSEGELSASEFDRSKRWLHLTNFKGQFFKRCPGARPGLTCCNYFVLNLGQQCNFNCSYCYLQSFINHPVMKIYCNGEQALAELAEMKELKNEKLRVGTGEVIDSLSLDELTLYSHELISFFRDYPKWQLEFKTKSALVDHFLHIEHAGNVVVSWSINPQFVIEKEEHGTASLAERLQAARRCRDKGFQVAFHLDPLIWHEEWQKNYAGMVKSIAESFSPKDMPYLSIGALRFQPEQRHMMRERFGLDSLVTQAEMFRGRDGKLRYDQRLREKMFRFLVDEFKKYDPSWNIFLCMESPETWIGAMSGMPKALGGLDSLFDHNLTRKFKNKSANPTQSPSA